MIDPLLEDLNPEQRRAVETTEGPLLIQAGAGSGKTKTLTHRIAYIIAHHKATPYNILAVTFTNKAAKEMRERVGQLLGQNSENRGFMPYMGTFHGICVRLLRQDGEYIGIPKTFVIFDESDRQAAVRQVSKQLMIDEKAFPARAISGMISSAKNDMVGPQEFAGTANTPGQHAAAQVYPLYERSLREASALDFDDLINRTVQLLKSHVEVREKWQQQFKYVMIDEYQDTNSAQYQLVNLLTNENNNIAVVGDDWQSIYSWRGADFRNILKFENDFKGCTIIKLEQNYRSTKNILDAAHAVITKNAQRSDKELWTAAGSGSPVQMLQVHNERAEGEAVVRRVRIGVDSDQRKYGDYAVLYRTNAQSRSIEEAFVHYGIPYRVVGGVRFYDRKEIKDLLAYLRLIFQPEDRVSFERIVNIPARGVGAKSLQGFMAWYLQRRAERGPAQLQPDTDSFSSDQLLNLFDNPDAESSATNLPSFTLIEALKQAEQCPGITPKARKSLAELGDILVSLQRVAEESTVEGLIDSLLRRIDYLTFLSDGTPQGEARQENVKELLSVAQEYQDAGLSGFLEEVALVSDLDSADFGNSAVTLMTLHAAKGLEFPIVFMAGMEESIFPHSRALYDQGEMEEERRLCYVGMTRARTELYMMYATSRLLYGGVQHNPPSRFLSEIDSEFQAATSDFGIEPGLLGPPEQQKIDPNEVRYVPDLTEGDTVKHQVFGTGTVMEIDGDTAVIYFKGKGARKLNISFAPLEKL
ncbi:MAG: UvrD-helicase domain-containing protein [Patescibacteria group bacterium]|nr:UvrD-helicase domain-containing protein [Patescibacteria group bacterium]